MSKCTVLAQSSHSKRSAHRAPLHCPNELSWNQVDLPLWWSPHPSLAPWMRKWVAKARSAKRFTSRELTRQIRQINRKKPHFWRDSQTSNAWWHCGIGTNSTLRHSDKGIEALMCLVVIARPKSSFLRFLEEVGTWRWSLDYIILYIYIYDLLLSNIITYQALRGFPALLKALSTISLKPLAPRDIDMSHANSDCAPLQNDIPRWNLDQEWLQPLNMQFFFLMYCVLLL